ncbi:sensor histidine kinase [Nocardioides jishulii]|uniref:Sensor-like histidine kinase SenX3 n=1 Tax=Nocardioides jishulii TaxID=2575440 RepID=A0A4U2YLU0_9ACTN|nr:ATP-binding protein [Nocardioides jishulii]QCX27381.1 hypothetical protein FCL41_07485 [Nocardioides jishulii]TKI62187.1 hypothetical protein FC770_07150 [Nocardioides jishulii]
MADPLVGWPQSRSDSLVLHSRLGRAWYKDTAEGLRQVPATVTLCVSALIVLAVVDVRRPALLWLSLALVALVQVAASLTPWERCPRWVRCLPPLFQMIAVGMMDVGAGLQMWTLDILLLLPLLGLSLQTGAAALASGLVVSCAVMVAPVLAGVDRIYPTVHLVVTMAVLGAVGVRAQATVSLIRFQWRRLALAQDEVARRARQLAASRDTLRSVMRAATEQAIIGTDERGAILSVSSGAQRMFARSEQELLAMHVTDVIPVVSEGGDRDLDSRRDPGRGEAPGEEQLSRLVGKASTGGAHMAELEDHDVDGAVRHLEYVVTARPRLEGADPDLSPGYLFVVTDVSSRWEDERRQDEFISLVSHELRTPLVSILGYVELLRLSGANLDEEQQEYIDVLERNTQRLRGLVDDLLASAQLVFGAPLSGSNADVVKAVEAAVKAQLPAARAADVEIEVGGDPVVQLVTDPTRVEQVVDNLVSNAVKYSVDGGRVTVSVHSATTEEGHGAARITVTDHGTGISQEELTKITERFYRTHDSRRRRVRGIGLGLSLVQAVVAEHGGTLDIRSEVGVGTQVEVVLPDLPLTASAPTDVPGPPSAPESSGRAG